jgi:hypothetical protein
MYVIGGYGSLLFSKMSNCGAYACGDTNAGSYRHYHNVSPSPLLLSFALLLSPPRPPQDIWRSRDGEIWEGVNLGTTSSFSPGRGGHQIVALPNRLDATKATFYLFGGSTGNPSTNDVHPLNDIWIANSENPGVWTKLDLPVPWTPRWDSFLFLASLPT